jgi:hypothetical protein
MTMGDFDSFAQNQADWSQQLDAAAGQPLFDLLEWARSNDGLVAGCSNLAVSSMLSAFAKADEANALVSYAGAVSGKRTTARVEQAPDIHRAVAWGKALQKLEAATDGDQLKRGVRQDREVQSLDALIGAKKVDDFASYLKGADPLLTAENGAEVNSYLEMWRADGKDPLSFKGAPSHIRNLHHFEAPALTKVAANEADTKKAKPLLLILHSGMDHNGAFHRDPNITTLVGEHHNLALIIEGAPDLATMEGEIGPLAQKYGQGDRVAQVMIAGHGNNRVMELTGDRDKTGGGGLSSEPLNLDSTDPDTEWFLSTLLTWVKDDPDARIVLNACLTASNVVTTSLSDTDPAKARTEIGDAIRSNPSLAERLKQLIAERVTAGTMSSGAGTPGGTPAGTGAPATGHPEVLGANASIGQVGFVERKGGSPTGRLTLTTPDDPAVTAAKIEYVKHGTEPTGVMRAVVECFATNPKELPGALKGRLANGPGTAWRTALIHIMLTICSEHPDNAETMRELAEATDGLSDCPEEDTVCNPRYMGPHLPAAHTDRVMTALAKTGEWAAKAHVRLAAQQVWLAQVPAHDSAFLTELSQMTCAQAAPYVSLGWLTNAGALTRLLGTAPAGATTEAAVGAGKIRLALLAREHGEGKDWLKGLLGSATMFPPGLKIGPALGGLTTPEGVLEDIGVRQPSAPAAGSASAPAQTANVDLDGDGVNDFYVDPLAETATTPTLIPITVHGLPDQASPKLGELPPSTSIQIIGRSNGWRAINYNGRTGFVLPYMLRF